MRLGAEASSRHQKEQHRSATSRREGAPGALGRAIGCGSVNSMISIRATYKDRLLEIPTFVSCIT